MESRRNTDTDENSSCSGGAAKINQFYRGKRVVVTGGTGFVGRNLVDALLRLPVECVIVFDRTIKYEWPRAYEAGRVEIICGDLLNVGDMNILESLEFDVMFHQAACVDTTCTDRDLIKKTNVDAFITLVNLCNRKGAPLVYASSAAVYGNSAPPNCEGQNENPLNIYGESKLEMDRYVARHKSMFRVPVIGLRYFNVYGPGEKHKGKMRSMVSQMAEKMVAGEAVSLFEFGEQMRDFVYVGDVVNCNLLAAMYQYSDVFNCGSGVATSFNEIHTTLCDCIGISPTDAAARINYIKNTYSFFQSHTLANISRTARNVGYAPQFGMVYGICELLNQL